MFGVNLRKVGDFGEEIAVKYLKKLGYRIIERNYQIRGGEIDIIAKDREYLVFIEVKARYNHKFGLPIESITPWKIKALNKSALFYIQKIRWGDRPYRFDLVSLDFLKDADQPEIELIKNFTL